MQAVSTESRNSDWEYGFENLKIHEGQFYVLQAEGVIWNWMSHDTMRDRVNLAVKHETQNFKF